MRVHRIEKSFARALHHFFEAQVRPEFCVYERDPTMRTCPPKKRDHFSSPKSFTANASGVKWLRNVGKKSIGDGPERWKYFL
jgi:hypothetical protein